MHPITILTTRWCAFYHNFNKKDNGWLAAPYAIARPVDLVDRTHVRPPPSLRPVIPSYPMRILGNSKIWTASERGRGGAVEWRLREGAERRMRRGAKPCRSDGVEKPWRSSMARTSSMFYRYIYPGIPLGREMIVGSHRGQDTMVRATQGLDMFGLQIA